MSNNFVPEKRKWVRRTGLNKKGLELVSLFDKCKQLDEKDKDIYRFYIQNRLKFNLDLFDQFDSSRELEGYLLMNKAFMISKKEQLDEAVNFIFEILNNDMVHLKAHTDARTNMIKLTKVVELTKEEAENLFYNKQHITPATFQTFVHQFVNLYMIKNANAYLACCSPDGNFTISTEQSRGNTFNINFEFEADVLDEDLLEEIGRIVMNMPKLA